jgi:hypothetical protein
MIQAEAAARRNDAQGHYSSLVPLRHAIPAVRHLATLFSWIRRGLGCRPFDRWRRPWQLACGDAPELSAVVMDSRTCYSAPSYFERGVDGGKKIRGIKIHLGIDKHSMRLVADGLPPANVHGSWQCR